jgi:hypothetical protein
MKFFRPFQHLAVAVMMLLGSAAVPHIGWLEQFEGRSDVHESGDEPCPAD